MLIAYKDADDFVYVVHPSDESMEMHPIGHIALKDVPEGLPFWIVVDSEIPSDRTFRNAWEIPEEWGEPDGYGAPYYTFEEIGNAGNQSY